MFWLDRRFERAEGDMHSVLRAGYLSGEMTLLDLIE